MPSVRVSSDLVYKGRDYRSAEFVNEVIMIIKSVGYKAGSLLHCKINLRTWIVMQRRYHREWGCKNRPELSEIT